MRASPSRSPSPAVSIGWRSTGADVAGVMLSPAPDLTLSFATETETLLFTLGDDEGALTRHRRGPGRR
jgi:hypothetical protein